MKQVCLVSGEVYSFSTILSGIFLSFFVCTVLVGCGLMKEMTTVNILVVKHILTQYLVHNSTIITVYISTANISTIQKFLVIFF